jgi:hypothetical protein
MPVVAEALALLAAHWDVVELVLEAAQKGEVPKAELLAAIKKVMSEASRAEVVREFPNG